MGQISTSDYVTPLMLMEELDMSRMQIRRLINRNDLPPPIELSPRKFVWLKSDIEKWLKSKKKSGGTSAKQGKTTTARAGDKGD